jgi:hypothetical protein
VAVMTELPINPSGLWSPVQAERVLAVLNPIVRERGMIFRVVDVSTFAVPYRVILVCYCIRHDIAVELDTVCRRCQLHP